MELTVKELVMLCDMETRYAAGYIGVSGPMSNDYLTREFENLAEKAYNEMAEKLNYSAEQKADMKSYFLSRDIDVSTKLSTAMMQLAAPGQNFMEWWEDENNSFLPDDKQTLTSHHVKTEDKLIQELRELSSAE